MCLRAILQCRQLGGESAGERGDVGHEVAGDLHAVGADPLARNGLDLVGHIKDVDQGVDVENWLCPIA